MSTEPILLHPTFAADSADMPDLVRAMTVANRVLHENGLESFAAQSEVRHWKEYFIFTYDSIENPELAYGGGATLVVRKSDFLGGMVFCSFDWLEQDVDTIFANIPKAFSLFDAEQGEKVCDG